MNELLANLNIMYVKTHNFHYNVVGPNFKEIHVLLEDEYDWIHETIDEVAEMIRMNDAFPAASMAEYLELATIKEVKSQEYYSKEILTEMINDYETLLTQVNELRETENYLTANLLEDIAAELTKKLWFFKSSTK